MVAILVDVVKDVHCPTTNSTVRILVEVPWLLLGSISTPVSQSGVGFSPFTECEWTITAPGNNVTKVNMTEVRMSPSQQGCENYWEFRNGPDKSSPLLKKHCGGSLSTVVSSSPSLYVKWHSGKSSGQVLTVPFVPAPFDLSK